MQKPDREEKHPLKCTTTEEVAKIKCTTAEEVAENPLSVYNKTPQLL